MSADYFPGMGPYFGWLERMVFANQWVFKSILPTTIAPTMLVGSHTENVLPQQAIATVNFRIHPRDTVESVKAWVVDIIDDDRIEIASRSAGCNASPVSSTMTDGFALLSHSFASVFEGVAVVPDLTLATTDSTHFLSVAKNSYRINPFVVEEEDLLRIHGVDERISLENLEKAVQFYALVMQWVQGQTGVTLQPCTLWG
ncbi:MAG: peptidase dimerization domain-containing protein [Pseudoruegeria sp.]